VLSPASVIVPVPIWLSEAELYGAAREIGIVLDPREPLFLTCGNDATVDQKGRCRIVKTEGKSENLHFNTSRQRPLSI
jgi:hypothetical protein